MNNIIELYYPNLIDYLEIMNRNQCTQYKTQQEVRSHYLLNELRVVK